MTLIFSNNAQTTIAGSITNVATSVALAPGSGIEFPNPAAGQTFVGTFNDAATGLLYEIVSVTARSTDTLTIVRAQEGTTALAWNAGDIFGNFMTAGTAAAFLQGSLLTAGYAVDTGAADAYVVAMSPAVTAYVDGMKIRAKIANTNLTTTPTLNAGAGALSIVDGDNAAIAVGTLAGTTMQEFTFSSVANKFLRTTPYFGRLINIQRFTSTGVYTPTTGALNALVWCQGAGGGGGGCGGTGASSISAGAGGTAGSLGVSYLAVATISGATVTIGTGGAGGIGNNQGSTGNTSSVGAVISAPGGGGGPGGGAISAFPNMTYGGVYGTNASGGNLRNTQGEIGSPAYLLAIASNSANSGKGGDSYFSVGGAPLYFVTGGGNVGQLGSGGSGAMAIQSQSAQNGAPGGNGYTEIWEFAA